MVIASRWFLLAFFVLPEIPLVGEFESFPDQWGISNNWQPFCCKAVELQQKDDINFIFLETKDDSGKAYLYL